MSMEVQAKLVGVSAHGYMVNVRTAHPKGMIGDAGYIRYFDDKNEAKQYVDLVNSTGVDVFAPSKKEPEEVPIEGVEFVPSDKKEVTEVPKISFSQLAFSRLTDEQIKAINETKKLPEGAKFVQNGMGGYTITNNIMDLRAGTRDLPVGYELKKNVMGFTVVVPVGTEGLFVKQAS